MSETETPARTFSPLVLALAGVAAIGWLAFVVLWFSAASTSGGLQDQVSALQSERDQLTADVRTLEDANLTLEDLQSEVATLTEERDDLAADRDAATAELAQAETRLEEVTAALTEREERIDTLQPRLAEAEDSFSSVQDNIAQATAELADVGSRLQAARDEEAQLRDTAAQMAQEASETTTMAAEMEAQMQEAREAQADAQTQLAELRASQAEFEQQRESLETLVAELEGQRTGLESQIADAQAQRDALQIEVEELADNLAARSEQLATLEAQFTEAQAESDMAASAQAGGLAAGQYVASGASGPLTFAFADDGSFAAWRGMVLDNESTTPALSGTWSASEDALTVDTVDGGTTVDVPFSCDVATGSTGFVLEGDCPLEGVTFRQLR